MKTHFFKICFLQIFFSIGCFSTTLNICTNSKKDEISPEERLHHVVLCWLKEPGNKIDREKIIEVTSKFCEIPCVIHATAGEVVMSDREIVDDSFDVGILIVTKDQADLQKYLVHPIHQKAKKEVLLPLVKKVLVYDFLE